MKQASDFDPAMRVQEDDLQHMQWLTPFDEPLRLQGLGFPIKQHSFRRLPVNDNGDIPEAVDYLASNSAGVQVQFKTNSKRIGVAVELAKAPGMVHMPATGQSGCDLYIKHNGQFIFYHTTKFDPKQSSYNLLMFEDSENAQREFIVNLPLYEAVQSLHIGIDNGTNVSTPSPFALAQPVVIYGTSITQGGCASRPGMVTSSILSRRLNIEFINLGFSGSGRGEPPLAAYISQIDDPALIILDYEANTRAVGISATMPAFVDILRQHNADVPILVISSPPNAKTLIKPDVREQRQHEIDWQHHFVKERQAAGDAHIHFLDGSTEIAGAFQEGTVDGIHPTDLGFLFMADHWEPILRKLLHL